VPGDPHSLSIEAEPAVIPISKTINNKEYFVFANDFSPWKWQFVIIRDAQLYAKLINKIKLLQLLTIGSLVMIALLLIFFVTRSIHGPSRQSSPVLSDRRSLITRVWIFLNIKATLLPA
jgi:hypothetical protein